ADINTQALKEWSELLTPDYYHPQYSTTPHPFMGLDRFTAGCFHQMRAGKSYLAAHPSWHTPQHATSLICPRCDSAPEDMTHALLDCPATTTLRQKYMLSVRSVSPAAPLWASTHLLVEAANFIHAARINYPPPKPNNPPPAPGSF